MKALQMFVGLVVTLATGSFAVSAFLHETSDLWLTVIYAAALIFGNALLWRSA